jgi:o-succinylbenzoate synthase
MKFSYRKLSLPFIKPAVTSAGAYQERETWYLFWEDNGFTALGECAPLSHLSIENDEAVEQALKQLKFFIEAGGLDWRSEIESISSVIFAMEMAEQAHIQRKAYHYFTSPFTDEKKPLSINGLIWMAPYQEMLNQIEQKIEEGWKCIKLKIGAIDFEQELKLIAGVRERFTAEELELRVDANGSFSSSEVLWKLEKLAPFGIHSIEQPVKPGQWDLLAKCVEAGFVPIALDEELIPLRLEDERRELFHKVNPHYVVLKPSLIGGFVATKEWLKLASENQCGSWVTSSLESNVGLLALAQWTAKEELKGFQGLGTGKLMARNFPIPASIKSGVLVQENTDLWSAPYELLIDYLCPGKKVHFFTSGSTGEPKEIIADKDALSYSCKETNKVTMVEPGDSMLIALPMRYVAAKMQVLRAWDSALQLTIVEPSSDPLLTLECKVDITSLVPYQLEQCIKSQSVVWLRKLLLGGSKVNKSLEEELLKNDIMAWETYGMTETYSNIALRQIGVINDFCPIGDTLISHNEESCLVINSKNRKILNLETRDLVRINKDGTFKLRGRIDNVINSGGIKINPADIEQMLEPQFAGKRYFIHAVPSSKLGEAVGLFVEGKDVELDFSMLKKMEKPRHIFFVKKFSELKTGKIDKITIVQAEI